MSDFQLDERLQNDTIKLASWPLCEVLLMNDTNYPWVILVPRIKDATELYQLDHSQRQQFDAESDYLVQTLMSLFQGDKMNVAALGNVVKQLHIHHVVRFETDQAWPAPIWGKFSVVPYTPDERDNVLKKLLPLRDKSWS